MPRPALLKFKKITPRGFAPIKVRDSDAGYDLRSAYCTTILPRSNGIVNTDIGIQLPMNTYGRIAPRSGLALHKQIDIGGGVIDREYVGPIIVIIFNHSNFNFVVHAGDRIAQLIVEKIQPTVLVEVQTLDSPSSTLSNPPTSPNTSAVVVADNNARGSQGLGSSGTT